MRKSYPAVGFSLLTSVTIPVTVAAYGSSFPHTRRIPMDQVQRAAAIERLRGCIAAGHRNITDIHLPLAELLLEDERRDDAADAFLQAATIAWEDGFILKAFACLRRCLGVAPEHQVAHARRAAWLAVINPDLRPLVTTRVPHRVVYPLRLELEELHRSRITTCVVRYDPTADRLTVTLDHPTGAVPQHWLETSRFSLELVDAPAPIPVAATIVRGEPTVHELKLTPAGGDRQTFSRSIRVGSTGTFTNIAALVIDTGVHPPYHVRNIYSLAPLGTIAEA